MNVAWKFYSKKTDAKLIKKSTTKNTRKIKNINVYLTNKQKKTVFKKNTRKTQLQQNQQCVQYKQMNAA